LLTFEALLRDDMREIFDPVVEDVLRLFSQQVKNI
jgi:hypothetical protein